MRLTSGEVAQENVLPLLCWALHTENLWKNSIPTRKRLFWLEIDQVIQIPPWRETKGIGGSRLPGKKTTWQHSLPHDFILAITAEKQTVQPFISNTDTILHTSRLRRDPVWVLELCNSRQTIDLHTAQGWFLSTAASLTRLPEDVYNGHYECFLFNAGCWFHSVWSPLALQVWVDVRWNVFSNRW